MGLDLEYKDGQTKLEEEEKEGLKIAMITSHKELDEYEQLNIEKAVEWLIRKKFSADQVLTEDFIRLVHKKMYSDVWKWASIGIELKVLLDDTKYWIGQESFPPDEIALRFKHRL